MEENELPDGWVWTTLASATSPTRMSVQPTDYPALPFVGMEHVAAETMKLLGTIPATELKSNALHFYPGDVLYGRLRPYLNKVLRADFEGLCSAEFIVFRESPNLEARYLQYFLNSWSFKEFASHLNEGDRPRVDWSQLKIFPFPLAPLLEQQRIIAAIEQQFTRLDAGVAALKSVKMRLKRYRAAVLKAAVEGKLTETWRAEHPTSESASQLLTRILQERRAKWEADLRAKGKDPTKVKYVEPAASDVSELGELPEGWCWATFEQVSQRVTVGFVGTMKDEYIEDGIPFLRGQNVRPNYFDPTGLKFISSEFHQRLAKSALEYQDILIVRSGAVGTACVMPDTYTTANCSDLVIVKQPIQINPYYAAYYMNSTAQDRVRQQKVGIALTHFNTQSMAAMPLPLPSLEEQQQIVSEVERRLSIVSQLEATVEANLKRAERLRQSILKEAFAGRLVPQNPDDEPASVLLERIRQEREEREAQGASSERKGRTQSKKDVLEASLWT